MWKSGYFVILTYPWYNGHAACLLPVYRWQLFSIPFSSWYLPTWLQGAGASTVFYYYHLLPLPLHKAELQLCERSIVCNRVWCPCPAIGEIIITVTSIMHKSVTFIMKEGSNGFGIVNPRCHDERLAEEQEMHCIVNSGTSCMQEVLQAWWLQETCLDVHYASGRSHLKVNLVITVAVVWIW